jgi:hypothetical protein
MCSQAAEQEEEKPNEQKEPNEQQDEKAKTEK